MTQMKCQIEIPKTADDKAVSLTVGREFLLHCNKEGPEEWPEMKTDHLDFRLDEADKFKIKLLNFKFISKTQIDLLVTSYQPGQHQLKMLQLVDAEHSLVLGDLDFTVSSVINPQEPPAEPYGPAGPFSLSLPIWYLLSLSGVILTLVLIAALKWRLRSQKRKLLTEMRLHEYVQDPLYQFYQMARKVQRTYGFFSGQELIASEVALFVQQINEAFKIYLARQLQIPTLKWSERKTLADIKRNHRDFYQLFKKDLKQNLAELSRAQNNIAKLSAKDCQQLLDLLRRQVDSMDAYFKTVSKANGKSFLNPSGGNQ